jgi:hypothetical protein
VQISGSMGTGERGTTEVALREKLTLVTGIDRLW